MTHLELSYSLITLVVIIGAYILNDINNGDNDDG